MELALDAFNIARPHGTGIATYGRSLANAAASLGHRVQVVFGTAGGRNKDPLLTEIALAEHEGFGWAWPSWLAAAGLGVAAARSLLGRRPWEIPITGKVIMPERLQLGGARFHNVDRLYTGAEIAFRATGAFTRVTLPSVDVAHWTYPLPVRVPGALNVYTLHDLVPLKLPYTTADDKRAYYRLCKRIARDADHILTVSDCSKRDIVDLLGVAPARVTNLYQSSDAAVGLAGVEEAELGRYVEGVVGVGLREYFLFFGAIEPKKNIARLAEAYLGSGSRSPLIVVGAPGWGGERDAALLKTLAALDGGKRIRWLGYLPRPMLHRLIAGARATLFPSLYEGFGLPVLESMELGTPVVTSRTSSLPEVGGDAAVYVDPYCTSSIAAGIARVDQDARLRGELAALGLRQAALFSPARYAGRLSAFYEGLKRG